MLRWVTRCRSAFAVVLLLLFIIPPAHAAPLAAVTVHFEVIAVQGGKTVTIRTSDFPIRTKFEAVIGEAYDRAAKGLPAGSLDSGKGGEVEATFTIPGEVSGKQILGLRVESKDGYAGYAWFFNRDKARPDDPAAVKPALTFSAVKKNSAVTVSAANLPPNTEFRVRVGPHYTFYRDYASAPAVRSGADGAIKFTLDLPAAVKDAEYIMVRLDGGGKFLTGSFQNADGGKEVSPASLVRYIPCQLVSLNPIPALKPREEFDVIWKLQNTSNRDWKINTVDVKFTGGTEMHKYESLKDLNREVKNGKTFEVALDMIAPDKPGYYTTQWAVVQGSETLCVLSVGVAVVE